jgi:predicted AAA+ superfamily ATPase
LRHGYKIFVGTLKDKEIDFIAQRNNELIYIQVAYLLQNQTTIDREINNLMAIQDNYTKILVTLDDFNFGNIKGVRHINVWKLEEDEILHIN